MTSQATAGRSKYLDYAEKKGIDVPAPPPDKALIVFLRPQSRGHSVHASIYDGEEFFGFVQTDTCFLYEAEPGEHDFMVIGETANFMDADLEAGRIYFVQVKIKIGMAKARFVFSPVTAETEEWDKLEGWLKSAYLVEPKDSAREWYENNKPSVATKRSKASPSADRIVLASTDGVTTF